MTGAEVANLCVDEGFAATRRFGYTIESGRGTIHLVYFCGRARTRMRHPENKPCAFRALRNAACSNSPVYTVIKLKLKSSPPVVRTRTRVRRPEQVPQA
ncbi:hypothetical protein C8R43DRAFT_1111228 [Mycena crocata]|nr:hypothetical protein C8R43DRAFT_1111228 [Mycena crocata]